MDEERPENECIDYVYRYAENKSKKIDKGIANIKRIKCDCL